jgi:excisionase family DNA binding protein
MGTDLSTRQVVEYLLRLSYPEASPDGIAAAAGAVLEDEGPPSAEQAERIAEKIGPLLRSAEPAPHRPRAPQRPAGAGRGDRPLSEVTFLTVAEVATVLRVSTVTVYRLIHSGELPAIRTGRSFRVPEQAVHDYLRDAFREHGTG